MIAFTAAALDNGFRIIVVLTSDYLKLVDQTANRFGALVGPVVKDSTSIDAWGPDAEHIKKQIAHHGLVLICAKNQAHLRTLVDFLQPLDASRYPALILDDEADQATLDTTVAARTAQRPNAPQVSSAINRRTVRNDDPSEEGESLRERLPHHVFLQVTATPYALLLQNSANPRRPAFTRLLEQAAGYTGGELFFDSAQIEDGGHPPLVFVDEQESLHIQNGAAHPPDGLQKALALFLLAAGAQAISDPSTRTKGQNFLCHTSPRTSEHDHVANLIRDFLGQLGDAIASDDLRGELQLRVEWAYDELAKTVQVLPSLPEILAAVRRRLPRREIIIVNAGASVAEFGRELNFIVGGNILGRGLTIDNLLVTYYLRRAKISQMDTVHQHARMFGYRASLMPYTRVFLPESLAFRFNGIHVAEHSLRSWLTTTNASSRIPVETVLGLRPTRPNVLDTGSVFAYRPGEQVYPVAPALDSASVAKNKKIEAALKQVCGGALRPSEFIDVTIDQLVDLMEMVPYPDTDAGSWDPDMLGKILRAIAGRYGNRGYVFYRQMDRQRARLTTGATSGPELNSARSQGRPVLFMFRDSGKHLGMEFWYPTVVFPSDMHTQVFNAS